ncbi:MULTISPECIES: DUF4190 domain-containing protein [unclassified Rathayibacter]|uniref:DUF4190 domain-containing protein n=1 Tax=unclassified Rathayibacter TaxID=2609250 RepID=UPI000CE91CF0|nr:MULTISPECIES: DUF4190 domain-containing protein [unclassified Rathayibacter]PPF53998.1 DUF4190 domain-containing protein [Rathayibacter sp. AY1C2]PPG26478.1 DUF4190 domain-containing protein [Rathayibacter sp. AY2B9]PPG53468.1 DUF4190 domain-containing protein [Rathayibacter sp. AY2B7]PPG56632.1 DUF4190 domain-containing protein [Rathayibacter sp. AY1C7]PPG76400.1 DUF4190 domain-containing protein [Rathayibacter sp. AY1E5]
MTTPYTPASDRYNILAIIGFIASFFVSIVGIVLGFIALSQIKRTGEKGRGLALAAVIIGFVAIIITIISFVALFSIAATMPTTGY